jgi:type IV pilus assembly protein PilC
VLEAGYRLEDALRRIGGLVPRETIMLIQLGEATARLPFCLRQTTQRRYGTVALEVAARFFYPFALLWFMFGLATFCMIFIFPKFQRIFAEFQLPMPELSVKVAEICAWVPGSAGLIALAFNLAVLLISVLVVSPTARWYFPGISWFYRRHVQSQVLRWLGILFDAGKTVPEALAILVGSDYFPGVVHYRLDLARLRAEQGETLINSLRESGLLPGRMIPFLQSAERIHNLPWALTELGEHVGTRTVVALRRLSLVVAPALVVAIGILVGFFVVGMFLPLIEIVENLSHELQ